MQARIQTGKGVDADTDVMEGELQDALSRWSDQLLRVEAHLTDQNGVKGGADDLRCTLEAQVTGLKNVAVTHSAASATEAWTGALHKLTRSLETNLAKVAARRGRDSIRHPDAPQLLKDDFPL